MDGYLPFGHAVQYQTAMTDCGFQARYSLLYRMSLTTAIRGTFFIFITSDPAALEGDVKPLDYLYH